MLESDLAGGKASKPNLAEEMALELDPIGEQLFKPDLARVEAPWPNLIELKVPWLGWHSHDLFFSSIYSPPSLPGPDQTSTT